jgi:NitT/TauT family transport system permease protein
VTGRLSRRETVLWGVVGIVLLLVVMQTLVVTGLVSAASMPTAVDMLYAFGNLVISRTFLLAVVDTLASTIAAFAIAAIIMVPLGVLLGTSRSAERLATGLVEILRPVPAIALLPVAILALGIGPEMKIALAGYAALWPILVNTIGGVRDTDRTMIDAGRSFTWSKATIMRRIQLPSALPFIGSGARQSISVALVIVVTLELLGARSGIGAIIRDYSAGGRIDYVFAGILATALIGLGLHTLLAHGERRLMRWAPQYRKAARGWAGRSRRTAR